MRPLVASDTLGRAERNFAISFCVQDLILIIFKQKVSPFSDFAIIISFDF